ncbi:uncharacterized protein LOC122062665 [Macadamia integrifolia]|uniref:uncharacterized protein LOC122062665 n=1 Tax=Macadamia integrifolia TaxID=60698 RepID=UPI001C4EB9AD|nr:uncharacterized protein LOC122062665 [Macadamia integrifolia]
MEEHPLLQTLIPTTTATIAAGSSIPETANVTASISQIIYRIALVIFIAIVSIWANYEASKGFAVTIINDAGDTPVGHRFSLLFVSNDKATRIVLKTSQFAENILYPDAGNPKKRVDRVTIRFTGQNLTHAVVVNTSNRHEFVLHISPCVMLETNVENAMVSAVQRGMARVWLWDGEMRAPTSLLDGLVEYVSVSAAATAAAAVVTASSESGNIRWSPENSGGQNCWDDRDSMAVAQFLSYCEGHRHGFIGRLNQALREGWHVRMVDDALGLPAQQLCSSYRQYGFQTKWDPLRPQG